MIKNRSNGALVLIRSPAALAEAVETIPDDPARASAIGMAERRTVERYYPLERRVKRYDEALAGHRAVQAPGLR